MKLSTRLTTICQAITADQFQHIWDCCCDHGLLGLQLMADHPNSQVHFVDVMPHLINEIESRLKPLPSNNWTVHCIDAATLCLNNEKSHLVIIAGVGGDLLLEMVQAIMGNHAELMKDNRVDFILCPVRKLNKVREGLDKLQLGLVSEQLVKDNNQFYEVIHVSNCSNKKINLVGDQMWDSCNQQHLEYRNNMIGHYQKQPSDRAKYLLALYQNIN
jgi:tRNA (adenine22-N1)-methyltransferase